MLGARRSKEMELSEDDIMIPDEALNDRIDYRRNRFPFCVVWQPFPPLTWFFPLIGHTGITDSKGVVHDFQGPYFVESDRMMLGLATRYLQLDPNLVGTEALDCESLSQRWDRCVAQGNDDYRQRIHCLLYPNCNHHVAHCLNKLRYKHWSHYEMFQLWFMIFFGARFCGLRGFLVSFLPFIIVISIALGVLLSR